LDFSNFIQYCKKYIKGDEKGEAQRFLDHFFMAVGYPDGLAEAGAVGERRILRIREDKKSTSFADLVWADRVLIEMKKKGEDLVKQLEQAKNYWMDLVPKPQYVILCNFDEFWIYDFNKKVYEPLDQIKFEELERRKAAFNFLKPTRTAPVFVNNWIEITKEVAKDVAWVYRSMLKRKVDKATALNFCMQCVLAMFAEDSGLLPESIFTKIIDECELNHEASFDLISGLFRQMNTPGITNAGKYKGVDYFNGGLFEKIDEIELTESEILSLRKACHQDWSKTNPAIFGSIFENGMDEDQRHEFGAHYTHESDIKMIVYPCIVNPWLRKIEAAKSVEDNYALLRELRNYKVLDPACGSGNFLFVAFREMKMLEKKLLDKIRNCEKNAKRFKQFWENEPFVSVKQFFGIDKNLYAVELAKVTMMVAKELLIGKEDVDNEHPLPLDNLDENIICEDALFTAWPDADVIIGNPPFQSKRNMQVEFGADYVNKLRTAYQEVPGRADFCVYWFYKAHKNLKKDCYGGLVGTNTITQNYSREGSLDYIVKNGGTIIEAVSSAKWSGEAAVTVSIACWKKGKYEKEKILFVEDKKGNLEPYKLFSINSSLSISTDVISAIALKVNRNPKKCFQGQVPGHDGYLISTKMAKELITKIKKNRAVLKPHLIAEELIGHYDSQPKRFVIDFIGMDLVEASSYEEPFSILQKVILPYRQEEAEKQEKENDVILKRNPKAKVNNHHIGFYKKWWQQSYGREDLLDELKKIKKYIACSGVSKRNIFEFVSSEIIPNAAVFTFCFEDDYSFGIIQSSIHWKWWKAKCSTFETRLRYTANTVWDTFPWPQKPTQKQIEKISILSKELRDARNRAMKDYHYSLRDLYRVLEKGKHTLNNLHEELDKAVMDAYGFMGESDDEILNQLLSLNLEVSAKETKGEKVQAPGLPDFVKDKTKFVSDDCVRFLE